jgi:molybdate transport system substrate-binding protein
MNPVRCFLQCLLALVLPVSAAFCLPLQQPAIRVAAAADLQSVMPDIAAAFEKQTGSHVELSFGSSGNFFAQIQNGAPFDVFFSADDEFPRKLIESGRALPRSAVIYGIGGLVLWLPATAKCDPESEKWNCLLKSDVARIAIANPAHAPYGRAAVAALQSAHLYDRVRSKLVLGENVAQAAQFAQSGNAQAGILAYSQARLPAMRTGRQWEIPRDSFPRIEQTVVILKSSRQGSVAEAFVKFVNQGRGRELMQEAGFQPPLAPTQSRVRHK